MAVTSMVLEDSIRVEMFHVLVIPQLDSNMGEPYRKGLSESYHVLSMWWGNIRGGSPISHMPICDIYLE